MKRIALFLTAALAAVFLSACSNTEYLKAQAAAATADSNARVAEAQAAVEEAKAVQRLADKVDAGGAGAYLLVKGLKGLVNVGAQNSAAAKVDRPRDWLDYLQGGVSVLATVANAVTPIMSIRESGKTTRAGYDRDVRVEDSRQTGETARIGSVAQIARDVAANQPAPNVTNTYTLSGTGVLGSGTYTGPVTTTNRTCNGGTGAPGGGTTGAGGAGGSGQGGNC